MKKIGSNRREITYTRCICEHCNKGFWIVDEDMENYKFCPLCGKELY